MSYTRARQLLLAGGLLVLLVVALVQYLRNVEPVEIGATLLFIAPFLGFVLWKIPGGLVGGALGAVGYILLRLSAIHAVGAGPFTGIIVSRSIAYLLFGAIGGWATMQLEGSLSKLELYDQIDDDTGLFNARFFVQDIDLEMSRSKRYETVFSLVVVEVPGDAIESLTRRKRGALLRDVGRRLKDAGRTVDRLAHASDGGVHAFAFVLPETGPEGTNVFVQRLLGELAGYLGRSGVSVAPERLAHHVATFPGDDAAVAAIRTRFSELDRREHPETLPEAATA
jgi:predicted signal transduction protein with EAL and GGDEF domain